MASLKIFTTSDGSHSILNESLQETYHSVHGALQESTHVFIISGMEHWIATNSAKSVSILEIGFGTGLNALLAMQFARRHNIDVTYITLEAFPLERSIWGSLNYASDADVNVFQMIHESSWGITHRIRAGFDLLKINGKLEDVDLEGISADVIFFDAFAPSKQPEMWSKDMLLKTVSTLKMHGVFVTYCAKGQVKRDLRSFGLITDTLPGPPGKKEMVRATRES